MKKVLLLLIMAFGTFAITNAQTVEELKAQQAKLSADAAALQGQADALQAQIDAFPGWKYGGIATIGMNLNNFSNWFQNGAPNTAATTIGIAGSAYANLDRDKYFWRSGATLNLGWLKFEDEDKPAQSFDEFQTTADGLDIRSLFGYKLNDKWAISALGQYNTSVLDNFNNPGVLDIGAGATWTPYKNLVVVFHPLNYNFIFADEGSIYESSLGLKVVADYNQSLPMGVAWRSNLSAFVSYSDVPNLSNWTWVNGFNFTAWKGIGVGFELGIRGNKQLAFDNASKNLVTGAPPLTTLDDFDDNELQTYWLIGLTYSLAK